MTGFMIMNQSLTKVFKCPRAASPSLELVGGLGRLRVDQLDSYFFPTSGDALLYSQKQRSSMEKLSGGETFMIVKADFKIQYQTYTKVEPIKKDIDSE